MDETIYSVPNGNWLYRFCCFFLFKAKKKLTYNEMYLLLYGLHRRKLGEDLAKRFAFERILAIYQHQNNNKLPNINEE
jgi:hypothetical protein